MGTDQDLDKLAELISDELSGKVRGEGDPEALPFLEILKWVRDNKDTLIEIYNALKSMWDMFNKPTADGKVEFNPAVILMILQVVLPLAKELWPKIQEILKLLRDRKVIPVPTPPVPNQL